MGVAFEVLEHLINPVEFLRNAHDEFQFHTCFFSATCFEEESLPQTDWWYWVFESGQHLSFFSKRALLWMAEQLQMRLWHIQDDVFAFSLLEWRPLTDSNLMKLWKPVRNRIERFLIPNKAIVRESLTWPDHFMIRDKMRDF